MTFFKHVSKVLAAAVLALSGSAWSYDALSPVAEFEVTYVDAANYGFNESGLGTARKTALEYALSLWAAKLKGGEPIKVTARCQSLGGTNSSAVLANAGPLGAAYIESGNLLPHTNTYYPLLLINQYGDQDYAPASNDMQVTVNVDVDNSTVLGNVNFYYGTDADPGIHIDLVTVLLHELGHGLGFLTFMDQNGAMLGGLPDAYLRNLIQQPGGALIDMTDAGRQSATISNALYWDGISLKDREKVNEPVVRYGNVKMYAPGTYQGGSSVSHFDLSNSPDLLMEPSYNGAAHDLDVTGNVLRDIGWFLDGTALPVSLSHFNAE